MSEVAWYQNPKVMQWVYSGVALLLGATGTNLDRVGLSEIVPTSSYTLQELEKDRMYIHDLERRVDKLEKAVDEDNLDNYEATLKKWEKDHKEWKEELEEWKDANSKEDVKIQFVKPDGKPFTFGDKYNFSTDEDENNTGN